MDEGIKIALFNQMLKLEATACELQELIERGKGKEIYNFKTNRTAKEELSRTLSAQDSLYLAFGTLGIANEYISWSLNLNEQD